MQCFDCFLLIFYQLNSKANKTKTSSNAKSITNRPSYTHHTSSIASIIDPSYIYHAPIMHASYTHHTPIIHPIIIHIVANTWCLPVSFCIVGVDVAPLGLQLLHQPLHLFTILDLFVCDMFFYRVQSRL